MHIGKYQSRLKKYSKYVNMGKSKIKKYSKYVSEGKSKKITKKPFK